MSFKADSSATNIQTGLSGSWRVMATLTKSHWGAVALAIFLVAVLRLTTPIARPVADGMEYLKVATNGLDPHAQLAAPFVYRFAVPLIVHGVGILTGAEPTKTFPIVTFLSVVALLLLSYVLARSGGSTRGHALLVMLLMAGSLFIARYPLYFPWAVDVEALGLCFLTFVFLLQRNYMTALVVSCIGLLFKEFLLCPLIALIGLFFVQYLHYRTTRPLVWTVVTVVLTIVIFLLPRLLIPVSYSFGTILKVTAPEPSSSMYLSELRRFLAWPPQIGTFVNILLAFISFWLPVLMLLTPARFRSLWQMLRPFRALVILWMSTVLALASVGGTNIMIFVTYSAPVLVVVLTLLFRSGVGKVEVAAALAALLLFNRVLFTLGSQGGDAESAIAFFGAYSHLLNSTTLWRLAEAAGWILLGSGTRWILGRTRETAIEMS